MKSKHGQLEIIQFRITISRQFTPQNLIHLRALRFPGKEELYVALISKWHITEYDNLLLLEWIIRGSLAIGNGKQ